LHNLRIRALLNFVFEFWRIFKLLRRLSFRWRLFIIGVDQHDSVVGRSILFFLDILLSFRWFEASATSPHYGDAIFVTVNKNGRSLW